MTSSKAATYEYLSRLLPSNDLKPFAIACTAIFSPLLGRAIYRDYQLWYSLGVGGVPHNVFGWTLQAFFRLVTSRDSTSVSGYEDLMNTDLERRSFIESNLPIRKGLRPSVGSWVVPQRQLEDKAGPELKQTIEQNIHHLAQSNEIVLEARPSIIEAGSAALFIRSRKRYSEHRVCRVCPEETFHIHESDGSAHAVLSVADAKAVIGHGWGERHRMSGKFGFPFNYTLLYAPRDGNEVEMIARIMKAAAQYAVDGEELT